MLQIGCPFCGLTDHGVISGHIDFDKAMRKRGINPVFGCELYHGIDYEEKKGKKRDQAHLIALAMTDEGLRNLWRLVNSTAQREKFHNVGRVSNEDIVRYKEGILFTSACPLGLVPQGLLQGDTTHLNWYLNNLGDNFRIEITTYPGDADWSDNDSDDPVTPAIVNELLVDAAQERGIPITYGDDGHYAFPEQFEQHDLYLAAQTGQSYFTPIDERKQYHPPGAVCIKDEATVREALHYLPDAVVDEAIQNTYQIGEEANAHLPGVDRPHLPVFVPKDCPWVEEDTSATDLFISLVEKGIEAKYGGTDQEDAAWERATMEMEALMADGLEHYFLLAWDLMQFCDKEDIDRGPGRGSSAGCIVAYALGITDVDPLYYDLYFERFWNPGRTDGFPDIDSDFPRSRREDIREYLIERWGEHRVSSIGTVIRMKPIAVIDKLKKPFGISFEEEKEIKAIVKKTEKIEIHGYKQIGWNPELEPGKRYYVKEDVGEEIEKWIDGYYHRRIFIEMCEHACSRNSNYGIHASGIVISDIDLDDYAPSYLRGGKVEGIPATMFPMDVIDALKLVKLDVLGLKTLDTISEWTIQLKEKGIEINWSGMDKEKFPDEMWDLLDEGYVAGLFQIETQAAKQLTEQLKPRSVEDLGILVALNRPGPDRDEYIARKEGRSPVVFHHPILEPILGNTYGLFVYQEQILNFMSALGYTLGEADFMRKILGKKEPQKLNDIWEGKKEWKDKSFLSLAESKGFTEEVAKEVWEEIEDFASYSFNKAHAICYAVIGFRCLVAKFYAAEEFYIACIRTVEQQKKAELMPKYIREAKRKKIKVNPPDIEYSMDRVAVHDTAIYFGFGDVSNVGVSGKYVVQLRDEENLDVSTPESFCLQLEEINDEFLKAKKEKAAQGESVAALKSPKQQINQKKIACLYDAGAWDRLGERDIALREKQKLELEYLGVIVSDNSEEIFASHPDVLEECDTYEEAVTPWQEKEDDYEWGDTPPDKRFIQYRLAGTITDIRPTKVKASGAAMGIVTIEYEDKELTFVCFSNKWKKYKFLFKLRNTGVFTIRHTAPNDRWGESYHFEDGFTLNE
jgi:DNA polymerase-3 subunit alpha